MTTTLLKFAELYEEVLNLLYCEFPDAISYLSPNASNAS